MATALTIIMLSSCADDLPSDLTLTEVETLAGGNWRVTYYFDNGDGVSSDFDGYTFEISEDGTIAATKGATTYTGIWMVKSSDDDPAFDKEIEFIISGDKQMEDLDGSWIITELSHTIMKLKDNTPSEEIHFEKF